MEFSIEKSGKMSLFSWNVGKIIKCDFSLGKTVVDSTKQNRTFPHTTDFFQVLEIFPFHFFSTRENNIFHVFVWGDMHIRKSKRLERHTYSYGRTSLKIGETEALYIHINIKLLSKCTRNKKPFYTCQHN